MSQHQKLGEILVEAGAIDAFQLRSALGEQRRWGRRLGVTLIKMGFLEERDLVCALARQLGLPVAHLEGKRVHREVLDLIPAEFAERNMCVPLLVKEENGFETLYLGMEDPSDLAVLDDVAFRTGKKLRPVMVAPSDLCEAIDRFYRRGDGGDPALPDSREPDWRLRPAISLSESLPDDDTLPELIPERGQAPAPAREPAPDAGARTSAPERALTSTPSDAQMPSEAQTPSDAQMPSEAELAMEAQTASAAQAGSTVPKAGGPLEAASQESAAPRESAVSIASPEPARAGPAPATIAHGLRALSELLIEKGVLTRDELQAKLEAVRGG